jgi:hypothetical protein
MAKSIRRSTSHCFPTCLHQLASPGTALCRLPDCRLGCQGHCLGLRSYVSTQPRVLHTRSHHQIRQSSLTVMETYWISAAAQFTLVSGHLASAPYCCSGPALPPSSNRSWSGHTQLSPAYYEDHALECSAHCEGLSVNLLYATERPPRNKITPSVLIASQVP